MFKVDKKAGVALNLTCLELLVKTSMISNVLSTSNNLCLLFCICRASDICSIITTLSSAQSSGGCTKSRKQAKLLDPICLWHQMGNWQFKVYNKASWIMIIDVFLLCLLLTSNNYWPYRSVYIIYNEHTSLWRKHNDNIKQIHGFL